MRFLWLLEQGVRRYRSACEPFWALMSQILTSAANFLMAIVIIRATGLEEFGRYSVCFLLLMISRNFLNAMVLVPMSVIVPKLKGATAAAYRAFLAANGGLFALVTSLLLYSLSGILGWVIGWPWLPEIALALALANFVSIGADFLRRYQFAAARPFRAFLIDAIRFSLQIALLLALALAGDSRLDANAAVYVLALGGFGGVVFGIAIWGRTRWRRRLFAAMWPRHAAFIRWMTPGTAMETLQSVIPQFTATAILGDAALGLIKAAQTVTNVLNLPWNALQQVLPSMAAAKLSSVGYPAMARFLRKVGYAMAGASIILGVILAVASPIIAEFANIAETGKFTLLMVLFVALNLAIAVRYPMTVLINAVEDPSGNFAAAAVGLVMAITLSLTAIPFLGEASIPIIAFANAVVSWTVLLLWHRQNKGEYKDSWARGI